MMGQLTVSGRSLDFPRDSLVHASDVTLNVTPGFTETRAQAKFSADEEIVSQREAVLAELCVEETWKVRSCTSKEQ